MKKTYTLQVQWRNGRYEVEIPELGAGVKAVGATREEALTNAERVVHETSMAAFAAKENNGAA